MELALLELFQEKVLYQILLMTNILNKTLSEVEKCKNMQILTNSLCTRESFKISRNYLWIF